MLCHKRLRSGHLRCHLLQLLESLSKLSASRWVLSAGSNQLHSVQSCLLIQIVQELDNLIEFVKVIDLNLALLELSKGSECSHSTCSDFKDFVCEHLTKRWDRLSLYSCLLAEHVVGDGSQILS